MHHDHFDSHAVPFYMLLIMNLTQSSEISVTERTVGKAREQRHEETKS